MARITSHDRKDILRAAEAAGKPVEFISSNRTKTEDGTIRYGRGDIMKHLKG